MSHTPTPWEIERSANRQEGDSYALVNAKGHTIVDTFNSGVACIHEESDEDGVRRWDEQGRVDIEFIYECVNAHARLVADRERLLKACKTIYQELDNRYDGADDSRVLWMGEYLTQLRNAIALSEPPTQVEKEAQ